METNIYNLYHDLNRFNLSSEYDFSVFNNFLKIVENAVGNVYYENLFLIYDAFYDLIQNYPNFKNLTLQNSSYLTLYNDSTQNLTKLISQPQYKKSLKAMVEDLLDINYQTDLDDKIEKIKSDVDNMLDLVKEANEQIRPTAEFEPLINQLKIKLNDDIKVIKSSYKKLRVLGELEFYNEKCKNQCRADFFAFLNSNNLFNQYSYDLFENLWNILNVESNILIECANLAMYCVIKPIMTTETILDSEMQRANELFNHYISLGSNILDLKNKNML